MPVIKMGKAIGATKRSNFINLRHNYIKEVMKNKKVDLKHVPYISGSARTYSQRPSSAKDSERYVT